MKKIHVILLSITAFAVIGFFVLETQQTETLHSSEISKLLKNTSEKNRSEKQQTDKTSLSSQINTTENDMQNMVEEIKSKIASTDNATKDQQAEEIIKRSDALIAKINKQYDIDTSHIDAIVTPDTDTIVALKSDDPEIQKLEQEQNNLEQEALAFEPSPK